MPLTTYTGTGEAEEIIPTEILSTTIDAYEFSPRVGLIVGGVVPGKGNIPKRFARWNQLTIPGAAIGIGETVDAPDANVDMTESTVTPARIRFRLPVSTELLAEAAVPGIPAGALQQGLEALMSQLETDILGASNSATTTVNAVTDAFEIPEFQATRQTYRGMELGAFGVPALVLHDDALDDLEAAIDGSTSIYLMKESDTLKRELGDAYQGRLRGFEVFRAPSVSAEGAGWSNFATPMGLGGGLVTVMNAMPNVVMSDGDEAHNRAVKFFHFELWKGQGLRNPRRFLEVLSST